MHDYIQLIYKSRQKTLVNPLQITRHSNPLPPSQIRKFRIDLQQYLVERTQAQLVSVLIEGGSGSLEEAQIRVRAGLPVVIIADSGRISNVLSLAVDLAKEEQVCDG